MRKYLIINFNHRISVPIARGFEACDCDVRELVLQYTADKEGNAALIGGVIREFKPEVVFSFGWWDLNLDISMYGDIVEKAGCIHVYWTFDDPMFTGLLCAPMAKFSHGIFTSDGDHLKAYEPMGVKAFFLPFACEPSFHRRARACSEFTHDILLLANNYNWKWSVPFPNRIIGLNNILVPLLDDRHDIRVYGLWWLDSDREYILPSRFYGGCVEAEDVPSAYSSCKIALGFLSVGTSETMVSMRVFEALGCGVLYLTQNSPALKNYFNNHEHLVWSDSPEETRLFADFYLKRDDLRQVIAQKGQELVYEKHTYLQRAKSVIETVEREFLR